MVKPGTHVAVDAKGLSLAFREAFRCHPAGVAIVTADPGTGPIALTVSSLISVSAEPPLVALSLSQRSSTAGALMSAETVVIHLARFSDLELAQLAATSGADRFGPDVAWERLPTGEPRYTAIGTWFRARLRGTLPLEGATLVAAELLDGAVAPSGERPESDSLVYLDRRWHRLGAPDSADG
ncbi:MAG: flavin reductase [Pararhodobacter sp.]|nr:flavin reductase [Pararhodobacter sp.]